MTTEYLLDTCIIVEIFHGNEKTKKWIEDNTHSVMYISGWTVIELLKDKKSKLEMDNCLKKLLQYRVVWNKPEFSDEIPEILKEEFHTQRENNGSLKGSAIFDAFIYCTAKSNSNLTIVTRNGKDFAFSKDVDILNLDNIEEYKRYNLPKVKS